MMFSLAIYDKLTPGALTGGINIAGTGTIDSAGKVGPIGGIAQKLVGAKRGGAAWFLAPAENCNEVVGHIPDGLQVVKVATFAQARDAVKAIAAKQSASLPHCT
jgi:PDZ domain-containing protein